MTGKTCVLITAVAIVLTVLALDDITTDKTATHFVQEWVALAICSGLFVTLGVRYARAR